MSVQLNQNLRANGPAFEENASHFTMMELHQIRDEGFRFISQGQVIVNEVLR